MLSSLGLDQHTLSQATFRREQLWQERGGRGLETDAGSRGILEV